MDSFDKRLCYFLAGFLECRLLNLGVFVEEVFFIVFLVSFSGGHLHSAMLFLSCRIPLGSATPPDLKIVSGWWLSGYIGLFSNSIM